MTRTEKLVYDLCNLTFLSLWSFANPLGKKDKELCDVLVICEPDIIIFSVKDIQIKDSGNLEVDFNRWIERAIKSSAKQIYGAERFLESSTQVKLNDGKTIIDIPKNNNTRIHRVAVAFGRGDRFPLQYGDFGNGFVHVLDERAVEIVLKELDTITDFVNYLDSKEKFIREGKFPFTYSEEDMLAYFISNNFSFPEEADVVIFESDLYEGLSNDSKYQEILARLSISYVWDNLIEKLVDDFKNGLLINDVTRNELELTIRQMAREDRNKRKFLSEKFLEFVGYFEEPKAVSRLIKSNDDLIYVFLLGDFNERERRMRELQLRCFVARSKFNCTKIIGLATEKYSKDGYSMDFSYSHYPYFDDESIQKAKELSEELNYFNNPRISGFK